MQGLGEGQYICQTVRVQVEAQPGAPLDPEQLLVADLTEVVLARDVVEIVHVAGVAARLDYLVDLGVTAARIEIFDSVEDAVAYALEVTDVDRQVIVTGSLYTVGAARHALLHPS